ncbi:hypothetical protein [Methylocapsa sp. S129]|uniref:hypothetical protein n=1 Tax=Methylocapsa sp. S129 TaxID=1641869 RepID=UPI00131D7D4F|nr:hypothetical protein [Methylocapsa sp. S129]
MAFGKRVGNPFGRVGGDEPAPSAWPPIERRPDLPNSRFIGLNLIQSGDGTKNESAESQQRIINLLIDAHREERGVQAETILSAVGALAGFAAQQAIWESVVKTGKMSSSQIFIPIKVNGEQYYLGDFLNLILASLKEGQLSIWRIVAGALVKAEEGPMFDINPIAANIVKTMGTAAFGTPTWPDNEVLQESPKQSLRHWPRIKTIFITAGDDPLHWSLKLAIAAQRLIEASKGIIPAQKAAFIVMEAAISMSKIDPRLVPGGSYVD